jgi:hypothetical protein
MNGGARGLGTVCFEGWEIMEGKENTIVFISLRRDLLLRFENK